MCEIVDRYAQQVAEDAVKEFLRNTARNCFQNGIDFETVHQCVEDISIEELKVIYDEVMASR